ESRITIGTAKLTSRNASSGAASAKARNRSPRCERRTAAATARGSLGGADRPRAGAHDRSFAMPVSALMPPLLGEPGVEALRQILAVVAPELDIADQIGLHMVGCGRELRQDIGRHELRRVGADRAVGDILAELRRVLRLGDIGQVLVGEVLVLGAFRD